MQLSIILATEIKTTYHLTFYLRVTQLKLKKKKNQDKNKMCKEKKNYFYEGYRFLYNEE